jgi:hypothetical protein
MNTTTVNREHAETAEEIILCELRGFCVESVDR